MPSSNTPRRVMLLTGASRGIGHATVKRFSAAGWRVITCSRHAFPENCPWEMGPEDHLQIDLSSPADTMRAVEETKERLEPEGGVLHALVNNAGISPKGENGSRLKAIETAFEDWQHVFQVNFFAPIMLARGLCDELTRAKGAVVNVTSIAGSRRSEEHTSELQSLTISYAVFCLKKKKKKTTSLTTAKKKTNKNYKTNKRTRT